MKILAHNPDAGMLDRLWEIHKGIVADGSSFRAFDREPNELVYLDSLNALRACVRRNPEWLESRIKDARSEEEPVHDLAYLVANLGDADLWIRCKQDAHDQGPA